MSFRKPLRRTQIERRRKASKPNSLRYEIIRNSVKRFSDGREVCLETLAGAREYGRRIEAMLIRQGFKCSLCGLLLRLGDATFDHSDGRGMGGARRNDVIRDANGNPTNSAAHWKCNVEKGSKRV